MPHIEYPKMVFHEKHGHKVVTSRDEQDALGGEWTESAAEHEQRVKEAAKKAEVEKLNSGASQLSNDANELEVADTDDVIDSDGKKKHKKGK